jgi:multicomponent Na+:H+ antiporter subunit A
VWRPLVVVVGLVTMIAGGLRALRPFDLKQLLGLRHDQPARVPHGAVRDRQPAKRPRPGCALLLAHGLFKAALFMVVGIVDHETHTRDIRELPTSAEGGPHAVVAVVSAASMAAIPPLAGFIAKEEAYGALVHGTVGDRLVLAGIVAGSVLTVAYSLRFAGALVTPDVVVAMPTARRRCMHHARGGFVLPGALLAAGSIVLGIAPAVWSGLIDHAAKALDPAGPRPPRALARVHPHRWCCRSCTLSGGRSCSGASPGGGGAGAPGTVPRDGRQVYDATVRGVLQLRKSGDERPAVRLAADLRRHHPVDGRDRPNDGDGHGRLVVRLAGLVGRPAHVPIAALLHRGRRRGDAGPPALRRRDPVGRRRLRDGRLFVVQGAPDLALTQFAVETLSVVVFLLVLRVPARPLRAAVHASGRPGRCAWPCRPPSGCSSC